MDGMSEPAPLRVVKAGIRYGMTNDGGKTIAWLPCVMWPAAAAMVRRLDEMNATADRMQALYDAAENDAFEALAPGKVVIHA